LLRSDRELFFCRNGDEKRNPLLTFARGKVILKKPHPLRAESEQKRTEPPVVLVFSCIFPTSNKLEQISCQIITNIQGVCVVVCHEGLF